MADAADAIESFYRHLTCDTQVPGPVAWGMHQMRRDGQPPVTVPDARSRNHAYCPTCCRWFPYPEFEWRGLTARAAQHKGI